MVTVRLFGFARHDPAATIPFFDAFPRRTSLAESSRQRVLPFYKRAETGLPVAVAMAGDGLGGREAHATARGRSSGVPHPSSSRKNSASRRACSAVIAAPGKSSPKFPATVIGNLRPRHRRPRRRHCLHRHTDARVLVLPGDQAGRIQSSSDARCVPASNSELYFVCARCTSRIQSDGRGIRRLLVPQTQRYSSKCPYVVPYVVNSPRRRDRREIRVGRDNRGISGYYRAREGVVDCPGWYSPPWSANSRLPRMV